jgi:hypothetical protein
MGRQHQRRGTVGEIQHWEKRWSYIEKDCFEKSQKYCSTGGSGTVSLFPPKLFPVSFKIKTCKTGLQLLNFWLEEGMLRCANDGVTTMIPRHQTTGNERVLWSDKSSFTLFPTSGGIYVWRTPKEAYNPECLVRFKQWNTGQYCGCSCSNVVLLCSYHYNPPWLYYRKGVRGQIG